MSDTSTSKWWTGDLTVRLWTEQRVERTGTTGGRPRSSGPTHPLAEQLVTDV